MEILDMLLWGLLIVSQHIAAVIPQEMDGLVPCKLALKPLLADTNVYDYFQITVVESSDLHAGPQLPWFTLIDVMFIVLSPAHTLRRIDHGKVQKLSIISLAKVVSLRFLAASCLVTMSERLTVASALALFNSSSFVWKAEPSPCPALALSYLGVAYPCCPYSQTPVGHPHLKEDC